MPQIWPMNWLLLFVVFASIFLIYLTFLYFNIHYSSPSHSTCKDLTTPNLNWKW